MMCLTLSVVILLAEQPGFYSRYGYFSWPLLRDGPRDKGLFPHLWVKRMGAEADHSSLSIVEIRFLELRCHTPTFVFMAWL